MDTSTFSSLARLHVCAKPLKAWYASSVILPCTTTVRSSLWCHEASTSACKPSRRRQLLCVFPIPLSTPRLLRRTSDTSRVRSTHHRQGCFGALLSVAVALAPTGTFWMTPHIPGSVQQDEPRFWVYSRSILSGQDNGHHIQNISILDSLPCKLNFDTCTSQLQLHSTFRLVLELSLDAFRTATWSPWSVIRLPKERHYKQRFSLSPGTSSPLFPPLINLLLPKNVTSGNLSSSST